MLCVVAYQLSAACLVGNPVPIVTRFNTDVQNPKVGDWVFEITSGSGALETGTSKRNGRSIIDHFGKLLRIEKVRVDELWDEDERWDEAAEGPCPTEDVWVIRLITGEEARWNNCSFIKVPSVPHFVEASRVAV